MSTSIPAHYRARARRDAAAFYLVELGRAVLAGRIAVGDAQGTTTLPASEFVDLKIEVTRRRGANQVDVTLRWHGEPTCLPVRAEAGAAATGAVGTAVLASTEPSR